MNSLEHYNAELAKCEDDPYEYFGGDEQKLRDIKRNIHPDKFTEPEEQEKAKLIFSKFTMLFEESKKTESIGKYRVIKKLAVGDLSNVYLVKHDSDKFIVKRSRIGDKGHVLIKNEIKYCDQLNEKFKGNIYDRMLPKVVESIDKSTVVYKYVDKIVSGSAVMAEFGGTLNSRHIIWMTKRALMILGAVHREGLVHGAITPDHLLFTRDNHGLVLCSWIHAGKHGDKVTLVPAKWKHYYPAETVSNKRLSRQLDIYMLGKSMLDIAGPNCHKRVVTFLRSLTLSLNMIPEDAWSVHDEIKDLGKNIFGNAKFVEL